MKFNSVIYDPILETIFFILFIGLALYLYYLNRDPLKKYWPSRFCVDLKVTTKRQRYGDDMPDDAHLLVVTFAASQNI